MDFVSSCGFDGAYGRDCGFVWVAWFFFRWPIVSVVVMGFMGFFWWWLAVGGQQRRETDVVGVEGREEKMKKKIERGEKKNFKNKIKN